MTRTGRALRRYGRPLEAVVADLLEVLPGHDPAGSGGEASVVGHEVGPGLLEPEADPARIDHLHRRDLILHELVRRAPVALERELHVVGGDRFAVVELDARAQDEFLDEAVLRQAPRFCQARRHGVARHGLYQRVVQRVEDHPRRADARSLGRVEPGGGKRDVDSPGHLAFGRGGNRSGSDGRNQEEERNREEAANGSHGGRLLPNARERGPASVSARARACRSAGASSLPASSLASRVVSLWPTCA
jgi:hypothetical protein